MLIMIKIPCELIILGAILKPELEGTVAKKNCHSESKFSLLNYAGRISLP